jgi:type IV pilus assembly protein PilN
MIRINLLPVREERRRADVRQFAALMLATVLGTALLSGLVQWHVKARVAETKGSLAQIQRQIDQFGPQLEKVKKYRETKAAIERKLDVIERLEESRSGPVRVLDELASRSPDRLWITRLEARDREITIYGMSLDNELVALFLTSLNNSPYFKNVELRETEAKEKNGFKLNEFELRAAITSPAAEKREAEKRAAAANTASTRSGQAAVGTGR